MSISNMDTELEKAAEEYAEKLYPYDSIPFSMRNSDSIGFQTLQRARKRMKQAFLDGAAHAQRWIPVSERIKQEWIDQVIAHYAPEKSDRVQLVRGSDGLNLFINGEHKGVFIAGRELVFRTANQK